MKGYKENALGVFNMLDPDDEVRVANDLFIELKSAFASGDGMRLGQVPSGDCPRFGSRLKSSSFGIPINQISVRL
jgi:hypothetical protein